MFLAPLSNLGPGLSGVVARKGSTTLEVILAGKAVVLATTEGLAELTGNVFAACQMVDHGF